MQMAFPPRHPPDATFLAHLVVPRVCGDAPDAHAGRVREVVAILAEHGWARYDNGTALWIYTLRARPAPTACGGGAPCPPPTRHSRFGVCRTARRFGVQWSASGSSRSSVACTNAIGQATSTRCAALSNMSTSHARASRPAHGATTVKTDANAACITSPPHGRVAAKYAAGAPPSERPHT